jgi:hypothetical protein
MGKGNREFVKRHFSLYKPALLGLITPAELSAKLYEESLPKEKRLSFQFTVKGNIHSFGRPESTSLAENSTTPLWSWDTWITHPEPDPSPNYDHIVAGGRIAGLDKDGGLKVRWVANPYRIHQHVLEPMKRALLRLCDRLPWDCTHDQLKCVPAVQKRMKLGRQVYSVDLSSATDFFPLNFQELVLRQLNSSHRWQQYVDLFVELSQADWKFGDSWLSWKRGQPMGLGPSFPAFALSHGLLLDHLANGKPNLFFVLGDDVVILDDELNHLYRSVLQKWGCPISERKSLSSACVAEFGGKVITPDYVFPCFKWKDIDDDNFLEMMRLFGNRFRSMITNRQRAVYEVVKSLQPPWGCAHDVKDRQESEEQTKLFGSRIRNPESSTCWSLLKWFRFHKKLKTALSESVKTLRGLAFAFDKKVKVTCNGTLFPSCFTAEGLRPYYAAINAGHDLPSLPTNQKGQSVLELMERIISEGSRLDSCQDFGQFEQKYMEKLPQLVSLLKEIQITKES